MKKECSNCGLEFEEGKEGFFTDYPHTREVCPECGSDQIRYAMLKKKKKKVVFSKKCLNCGSEFEKGKMERFKGDAYDREICPECGSLELEMVRNIAA
ncbi:MAG: hypothetical protein ACFE7E_06470 [Candidatus Hodarchaeota archaeon]